MANTEQLERLWSSSIEGDDCRAWNLWRGQFGDVMIDLSDANMGRAYLREVDLRGARLKGAILTEADLTGAHLRDADLTGARLSFAHLSDADLCRVDLTDANLMGANLTGVDLMGANLTRADLSRAILERTNLQACQMHEVYIDAPVRGEPIWPEMESSAWQALQDEARSPTTPAERLVELTTQWPGYRVCHLVVANPNSPQEQMISLAHQYPGAFLANPVLSLWWIENPNWLHPGVAWRVLEQARQEPDWPDLAQQHADLVALLEQYAAEFTDPS